MKWAWVISQLELASPSATLREKFLCKQRRPGSQNKSSFVFKEEGKSLRGLRTIVCSSRRTVDDGRQKTYKFCVSLSNTTSSRVHLTPDGQ